MADVQAFSSLLSLSANGVGKCPRAREGGETMKKAYITPRLTVHGEVEKITLTPPGLGKQCSGPDNFDLRGWGTCGGTPPGQ